MSLGLTRRVNAGLAGPSGVGAPPLNPAAAQRQLRNSFTTQIRACRHRPAASTDGAGSSWMEEGWGALCRICSTEAPEHSCECWQRREWKSIKFRWIWRFDGCDRAKSAIGAGLDHPATGPSAGRHALGAGCRLQQSTQVAHVLGRCVPEHDVPQAVLGPGFDVEGLFPPHIGTAA